MKLQVVKKDIHTLNDEGDKLSMSPKSTDVRLCKECNSNKMVSFFPKKGTGRYENRCKPCHNALARDRRSKINKANPILKLGSVPYFLEFTDVQNNNFTDMLFSLLKFENTLNHPTELQTIDSFLETKSNIETMLDVERKLK